MRFELRVLGPVLLILLAGYLASYPSLFDDGSAPFEIAGASVVGATSCPPDKVLFRIYAASNAHAESYNQLTYSHAVCLNQRVFATDRICDGTNEIVKLSGVTNAHVEQKDQGNYAHPVCYGDLQCSYDTSGSCPVGSECVAALSSATNAHVSDCSSTYPIKICCSEGFLPGLSLPRVDTDGDGVYDDGDGKGVGNNPCHPQRHSTPFLTCDDNCRVAPNGPVEGTCVSGANQGQTCVDDGECPGSTCQINQEDADFDGAGDICDNFPQDSCSIVTLGDNCQNYGACAASLSAQWLQSSVVEGADATLEVTGDSSCEGLTFGFTVLESTGAGVVEVDPQPAQFTSGKVTSTWQGEYHSSGSNTYSFQATSQQGIQVASSLSALLSVSAASSSASCGDGRVQRSRGEECDEGSNNCEYTKSEVASGSGNTCSASETCYNDCQLIPGQGGSSCRTAPECQGKPPGLFAVCKTSQPTKIQFCVRRAGGCLQLSTTQSCSSLGGVQSVCVPNLPSCQSPTCTYGTQVSSCTGTTQQITCTGTGGAHCTGGCVGYPKTQACFEEPQEDFPFYSGWNVLVTVLLLASFYFVRRRY